MTAEKLSKLQDSLCYSNTQVAKVCAVSVRTVERWKRGDRRFSGPAEKLLNLHLLLKEKKPIFWASWLLS